MHLSNPFEVPDPALYAIPFFVITLMIETFLIIKHYHKAYDFKEAFASISMGIGVLLVNLVSKTLYLSLFLFIYKFRIFESIGPNSIEEVLSLQWHLQHYWVWILLLFADDFIFYWFHRAAHEVRILWAGHVNHHSSQEYNLATALRQGWWEDIYKYNFWIVLVLIGFHPYMIFMMMQFSLIYQYWIHTELINRLGFLEWFMNTPSHHRVHHSSEIKYLDKNYAGIFIIWDRLFGTFQEEEHTPKYGITENIHTHNPLKIATHELIAVSKDFFRTKGFSNKIKYLFLAPGWSDSGEDKRARVLQKRSK